jgi:hypothetical protein
VESDQFYLISHHLEQQIVELLDRPDDVVYLRLEWELQTNSTSTALSRGALDKELTRDKISDIIGAINGTAANLARGAGAFAVLLPRCFPTSVRLDAGRYAEHVDTTMADVQLTLSTSVSAGGAAFFLPHWSMATRAGDSLEFVVESERVAPPLVGEASSGNWGLIGIYLTVVYAIGRFLRTNFEERSKFMPYEELPDTTLLLELCSGIYIARIQGLLETEYMLYYQLVHIYRSPELLLDVSRPQQPASANHHGEGAAAMGDTSGQYRGNLRQRTVRHL